MFEHVGRKGAPAPGRAGSKPAPTIGSQPRAGSDESERLVQLIASLMLLLLKDLQRLTI